MDKKPNIFNEDESLEKEVPLLHSVSKENPFLVPDGYFDSLPAKVMERCREEVVSSQWAVVRKNLISYITYLKYPALAASLVVVIILVIHINNKPVSYEAMAQNIPDSLIVANLDNNIASINENTLEEYQTDEEAAIKSDTASGNDDEVIAYLLDHNINISDIENNDKL